MKDIILIHKSYKISGKYRENNKPLKYSTSESQYSSHPNYMKMWICSTSCLNITENRNTNMVGTRENGDLLLIVTKAKIINVCFSTK